MQDTALNFLFKQTRGKRTKEEVDATLGFEVDAVCKVSSSNDKNYIYFNDKVVKHFGLNADNDYATVFGQNPATKEITFILVPNDPTTVSQYPTSNTNKVQKGNLKNNILRITSVNAIKALLNLDDDTNEWEETVFSVNLSEAGDTKIVTIGNVLSAPTREQEEENSQPVDADQQQEVEEMAEDLPFSF